MGDDAYVREIYEASYRRLVSQMYGVAGNQLEAEDAVQEAFARAVAAGNRFSRVDNPEAWLRTVALNVIRRRWRRGRMFNLLGPRLVGPSQAPATSEEHLTVVEALRSLPYVQREVLALFYLGDMTVQEVAATLGIAPGTVKSRLSRGREALVHSPELAGEVDHG